VSNPDQPPPHSSVIAQALTETSVALTSAPFLAAVVREGVVESFHRGTVVVTAPDGSVVQEWGDSSGLVLPRSANKPLQAVGMLALGLDLPPEQLALASASHSGEPFHLAAARALLAGAGLTERDLQNTSDYPYDEREREVWIRAGRPKSPLGQNCSGKHAAMLATCVARGWDTSSYRDVDHPLQRALAETITALAGSSVGPIVTDGCGAPQHGIPLAGLARAFGRLAAAPAGTHEARVAHAMRAHPDYVGGTGRQVTTLIRETPGLVAKDGAEAVYAVGLGDGRGLAVKIADGSARATPVVLAAVLRRLGVGSQAANASLERAPVLGHGVPVGAVVATGI
jgi:L-asparaginase II